MPRSSYRSTAIADINAALTEPLVDEGADLYKALDTMGDIAEDRRTPNPNYKPKTELGMIAQHLGDIVLQIEEDELPFRFHYAHACNEAEPRFIQSLKSLEQGSPHHKPANLVVSRDGIPLVFEKQRGLSIGQVLARHDCLANLSPGIIVDLAGQLSEADVFETANPQLVVTRVNSQYLTSTCICRPSIFQLKRSTLKKCRYNLPEIMDERAVPQLIAPAEQALVTDFKQYQRRLYELATEAKAI